MKRLVLCRTLKCFFEDVNDSSSMKCCNHFMQKITDKDKFNEIYVREEAKYDEEKKMRIEKMKKYVLDNKLTIIRWYQDPWCNKWRHENVYEIKINSDYIHENGDLTVIIDDHKYLFKNTLQCWRYSDLYSIDYLPYSDHKKIDTDFIVCKFLNNYIYTISIIILILIINMIFIIFYYFF